VDRSGALAGLRATVTRFAATELPDARSWCVALSGGPDSLALTAASAVTLPTTALIVDHGLQPGSAEVAQTAREQAIVLGCVAAHVLSVRVGTAGGPEAAARAVRYKALDVAREGAPVLLGHTLDDQAETVLLGLGRGSGPRSIAGMRPADPPWYRPLLGVRRAATREACAEVAVPPWDDPHNHDRRFTRVRLRDEVLPLLDDVLGGGVPEALVRTAAALREDTDLLDAMARDALAVTESAGTLPVGGSAASPVGGSAGSPVGGSAGSPVGGIAALPAALRRRVLRAWLLDAGAIDLTDAHLRRIDALVTAWRGQGGVAVSCAEPNNRLFVERRDRSLVLRFEPVRLS
jgi:tRNA(Ile)-lysidine synthase